MLRTWKQFASIALLCVAAGCTISPIIDKHFADDRDTMLFQDLVYPIGKDTGITLIIPAGFVTDYASTPWYLWTALPPHGQYSKAAIIHDYLYWTQACTKAQADNLLLIAMKESNVSVTEQILIYKGVDWGGQSAWNNNRQRRAEGFIKRIPVEYRNFPDNISWPAYQEELRKKSVKEELILPAPEVCSFGNSAAIPQAVASVR